MDHTEWNPFLFGKLKPLVSPGWTCVDVGANHGEFTKFFSELPDSKVYAFEMNPGLAEQLKKTFPTVTVENFAISDTDGTAPYFGGVNDACYNIIGHNTSGEAVPRLGDVPAMRLDSYFHGEKIDIMKMDIEGAELRALDGLARIAADIDMLLLECHLDEDWEAVRAKLFGYGWSCINFYDDTPITETSSRPYQCLCRRAS